LVSAKKKNQKQEQANRMKTSKTAALEAIPIPHRMNHDDIEAAFRELLASTQLSDATQGAWVT